MQKSIEKRSPPMSNPTCSRRAAKEIWNRLNSSFYTPELTGVINAEKHCPKLSDNETCPCGAHAKCEIDGIAAIIDRNCGRAERVLEQTAKWATNHQGCPGNHLEQCPFENGKCGKSLREDHVAECWLEYWKKEPEECQQR